MSWLGRQLISIHECTARIHASSPRIPRWHRGCYTCRNRFDPRVDAMARPIWNGTISFGLLNVPVQIYSGERTVDLHFRMLDSRDRKPIRYERVNAETGEEVAWKDIVKAFEYKKGDYVVIPEDELRAA